MPKVHITVTGNCTRDPELIYTRNGTPVTNLSIATSTRKLNKQTGEWEDGTVTFYQAQCWKHDAENVCKSVRKGDRLIVTGDLVAQQWEDDKGVKRTTLRIQGAEVALSTRFVTLKSSRHNKQGDPWSQDTQNGAETGHRDEKTGWVVQDTIKGFQTPQNGSQGAQHTNQGAPQPQDPNPQDTLRPF